MTKPETLGVGLLPALALVAGLLSGSLLRPTAVGERDDKSTAATSTAPAEPTEEANWIADLHPAMETLGVSMGLSRPGDGAPRRLQALGSELGRSTSHAPSKAALVDAIREVGQDLEARSDPAQACATSDSAETAARRLEAFLLSGSKPEDPAGQLRWLAAEKLTARRAELATLVRLSTHEAGRFDVDFLVATVPDYVDSSSGWLADQSLAAIQSAMARAGYLLDQARLIEPPGVRTAGAGPTVLHERQPGALVFRKVDGDTIRLRLVLVVLETPTAGVHRSALRNAIRFVAGWQACTSAHAAGPRELRVLGPTFSGSMLSMAKVLGDRATGFARLFSAIRVISGSATADTNARLFWEFAQNKGSWNHVTYKTVVRSSGEVMSAMAEYLGGLKRGWERGEGVALLLESNTTYGSDTQRDLPSVAAGRSEVPEGSWPGTIFSFPLHVAQLRNDAPSSRSPASTLLATGAVPLNMRDSITATDLIPALSPQLTSPVVESTVNTILDAIRHDSISAVGIQATDERDVLFLAREVKQSSPDVQLFLLGANALYLHPDFVPYLRGAVVASTYSLSLSGQAGAGGGGVFEPFQSMAAEGLFNATLVQLGRDDLLLDYCGAQEDHRGCLPGVRLSVIGEDGFWPLPFTASTGVAPPTPRGQVGAHGPLYRPAAVALRRLPSEVPPFPTPARLLLVLVSLAITLHVVLVTIAGARVAGRGFDTSLLAWPVLRVFVPPLAHDSIRRLHAFAIVMASLLVGLGAAWLAAIVLPFLQLPSGAVAAGCLAALAITVWPAVRLLAIVRRTDLSLNLRAPRQPRRGRFIVAALSVPFLASMILLAVAVVLLVGIGWSPGDAFLRLARLTGGGIVSPAPATIGVLVCLYVASFTGIRRLSLIGAGYQALECRTAAFALLTRHDGEPSLSGGSDDHRPEANETSALAGMLDMPIQHLPLPYFIVVVVSLAALAVLVGRVTTIEGKAFSWFLYVASLTVVAFGLIYLAVGLATWLTARSCLRLLAQTPLCGSFSHVAQHVPWNLSLAPPRLMELLPAARLADRVVNEMRDTLAGEESREPGAERRDRRGRQEDADSSSRSAARLGLRGTDLASFMSPRPDAHVRGLLTEAGESQYAAVIQSATWMQIWSTASGVCRVLRSTVWARFSAAASRAAEKPALAIALAGPAAMDGLIGAPGGLRADPAEPPRAERRDAPPPAGSGAAGWVADCEQLLALQFAFVARDAVSRAVTALFAAMLCLTLLAASHLVYAFSGRSALITVDLLVIGAAALTSTWILIDMERDTVLSQLRHTTPGRVDLNWSFVQRIAVYGVLPILAILAALFPEIGGSVFGWLEPLRKLSAF